MIKTSPPGNNPHGSEMPDPSGSSEAVMGGAVVAGVLPGGRPLVESEIKSTVRATDREARLRWMVDEYIDFVARVLRNAGTPAAEVDDDVQRTFIAAARRLDDVRPGAERSFLLQTALYVAAHARRTLARRREVAAEEAPEQIDSALTPEQLTDQKRARETLDRVLSVMDADLRTVFVLYEFEELSMAEIADALSIPRGTVASRLRRARADFRDRVRALGGIGRLQK
ncbi:MAG TPA: sigma-70 family RNA polymerase sigma factor [Polyangiaceae bacterium]|nr:sigma-70 family RNA polymerase sigma factor [Polyangiaceae bacterium]